MASEFLYLRVIHHNTDEAQLPMSHSCLTMPSVLFKLFKIVNLVSVNKDQMRQTTVTVKWIQHFFKTMFQSWVSNDDNIVESSLEKPFANCRRFFKEIRTVIIFQRVRSRLLDSSVVDEKKEFLKQLCLKLIVKTLFGYFLYG